MRQLFPTLRYILLSLLLVPAAAAQTGQISGTVTDAATGEAIPGVNVVIQGTQQGAATNRQGHYEIDDVEPGVYTLRASFIGYASSTEEEVAVTAGETTTIIFALAFAEEALDEVVVVGYGEQQRRDVTGAISSVSSADLEKLQMPTVGQALQGRVAGVNVTQNSASPGGGVSIRIRGSGSLGSTNEPLYVVDGVPISGGQDNDPNAGFAHQNTRAVRPDPLAFLNPNDIQSIEVLKDASATAIYGARGTNGVVLITTKKGRPGLSRVEFESSIGTQGQPQTLAVTTAQEWAEFANEAARFEGLPEPFANPAALGDGPDWEELAFQTAVTQSHNLRVLGGTEATRFSISAGLTGQDGVVKGTDFQRYSVRGNVSHEIANWLNVGTNLNVSRINSSMGMSEFATEQGDNTNVINAVYGMPRVFPIYGEGGSYYINERDCPEAVQLVGQCSRYATPLSIIEGVDDQMQNDRVIGNVFAEATLAQGLSLRVNGAGNLMNVSRDMYYSRIHTIGLDRNGLAQSGNLQRSHYLGESILNFNRFFGGIHELNVMAGATIEHETSFHRQMENSNFPNDVTKFYSIGAGTREGGPSVSSNYEDWTLLSYLGRVNYTLAQKYLFTFTGRADGSSKFGADNKWGFFPSGAFAWRLSEEPFLADANWLSDLKLRVSYGHTGNQEIGTYRSLARLANTAYPWGGNALVSAYYPNSVANPELRWEKSEQFDAGFDAALLDHRLTLTFDVYQKTTDDLLMNVPLPKESGFGSALMNVGSIQNRGVEVALGVDVLSDREGFGWFTNFNVSANRNEVLDIGGTDEIFGGEVGAGSAPGLQVREGHPLGVFWGYKTDGILNTQAEVDAYVNSAGDPIMPGAVPGQSKVVDVNGDGVIDQNDRTILGDPEPDLGYGWTNEFSFGDFNLYTFVQGTVGNSIFNANLGTFSGASGRNLYRERWLDRWTPENTDAEYPAMFREPGTGWVGPGGGQHGDLLVEDGSYLRLKNVTLSYNLPASLTSKLGGLRSAQIYVNAENLFTLTNYRGPNPDVNSAGQHNINRGIDAGAYPLARTYRMGVRIGL